jgi:hypothetical protein
LSLISICFDTGSVLFSAQVSLSNMFLRWLRLLVVLLPPFLLFFLEWFHPVPAIGDSPWQTIQASEGWWLQLHVLQLFLLCGLGLSVICLISTAMPVTSALPLLCSISFFLSFYATLDAVAGIASGIVVDSVADLSKTIQVFGNQIIIAFLKDPFVGGGSFSVTALLGGGGWLLSMIMLAAIAKREYQISNWVVGLLVVSGLSFGISHLPPTGPIGMFSYFFAAFAILVRQGRLYDAATVGAASTVRSSVHE